MRVSIHENMCIGCGLCEELLPETFIMQNQRARVKRLPLTDEEKLQTRQAAEDCPAEAIEIEFNESADAG